MYSTRFRDVSAQIRSDCVSYLGQWVIEYPALYSKNTYLRMLGWALSDKAPEVRMVAAEALTRIYAVDALATQIDMFTEAFRGTTLRRRRWLFVCLFVGGFCFFVLFVCLFVCLLVGLLVCLFVCWFVGLLVCWFVCLFVCLVCCLNALTG
jgi:hypothetical protein